MQGVQRVFTAACVLSLMVLCGASGASADVVFKAAQSTSVTSASSASIPGVTIDAGSGGFLAVTVSTKENATVTGVSYAGQALTNRGAAQTTGATNGVGARVELWTLSAPAVGTGTVTVTLNAAAPAVVGATTYTGVDGLNPLIAVASGAEDNGANAASLVLNNTTTSDGMVGAISYGEVGNTSAPFTQGSVDTVVADLRYSAAAGAIRGGGATRSGNTGQNQALSAGIVWRWTFVDGSIRSPHAQVLAGLRAATLPIATAPTVTTADQAGVTRTAATLGGDVTSDGGDGLTRRGVVYVAGAGTPALGGSGVVEVDADPASTGAFTAPATGLLPGTTYTYRAFATNSIGTSYGATKTFATATNHAPAAAAGGPYSVAEGSGLALSAAGSSDADGDALTYAWDLDHDGQYDDATGAGPTLTAAQLDALGLADGPTSHTIGVRVGDGFDSTTATTTLDVTGVAPTATLSDDGPVDEGSDAHVSFGGASDPSTADTAAGFHYAYDLDGDGTWDVGDGTYAKGVTATSATVPTTDDGTIAVHARIIDKNGDATDVTHDVTVDNGAPAVALTAPADTPIDTALTFTLDATDPSGVDAAAGFAYTVDWGDGTTGAIANGPAHTTATHTYTAPGAHTVTVKATDKDGAVSAAATRTVTIPERPAPPATTDTVAPTTTTPAAAPAPVVGASTPAAAPVKVDRLSVSPRCVKASAATTRSVKLKYQLSGAATVRVTLQRATGSKAVRRCPPLRGAMQDDGTYKPGRYTKVSSKQTSGGTSGTSLTIAKGTKNGAVGTVAALRPQALLAKGAKLKAGTYLITVTPLDARGQALSTVARVKFWVLKG